MREIIKTFRDSPGKIKFILAILGIACGSSLLTVGGAGWYYGNIIERLNRSHDRQISLAERTIRAEQKVNRKILRDLLGETRGLARDMARISEKLQITSETAEQAAQTAKSAASTAKGAAVNAAKSAAQNRIRIQEVKPGLKVTP